MPAYQKQAGLCPPLPPKLTILNVHTAERANLP